MQVKTTAHAPIPSLSIECNPDDWAGMLTGSVAVQVAPEIPLSRRELVTALLMNVSLTTEDLAGLTDAEVRREVGFTLAFSGLSGVQDAIGEHLDRAPVDAVERWHRELCEARVLAAFGLADLAPAAPVAPVKRRSRIGDAVAYSRRIVVRAA